jgi:hypothetical protein
MAWGEAEEKIFGMPKPMEKEENMMKVAGDKY